MKNQLLFILRGGEVERFHTVRTLQTETVAHHSMGVALLCYTLNPDCSKALLLAALVHDLAEQHTGDVPAPAKRELGVGNGFAMLEELLLKERDLGFELPPEEKRLLKLADCFSGMLFCIRERSMGNRCMEVVFNRYRSYIMRALPVPTGKSRDMLEAIDQLWEDSQNGGI